MIDTIVKIEQKDVFHVNELFLLSETIERQTIFGLPDRSVYAMVNHNYLDEAYELIKEKGILDESGKITEGGSYVLIALEDYANSKKYVQLNNLFIGFSQREPDNLIVLTEIEKDQYYQIKVVEKNVAFKIIFESLPIIYREPLEDETTFLLKKLRNRERRQEQTKELPEFLYMKEFSLEEGQEENPTSWICYQDEDKLYAMDTKESKYYRASQYWLMRQLFHYLGIELKEAENG